MCHSAQNHPVVPTADERQFSTQNLPCFPHLLCPHVHVSLCPTQHPAKPLPRHTALLALSDPESSSTISSASVFPSLLH